MRTIKDTRSSNELYPEPQVFPTNEISQHGEKFDQEDSNPTYA